MVCDARGVQPSALCGLRCCTTRRLNAHITSEQRVLYDWHPGAGRIVTVHSVLDKASDSVARCSLAREATGLPLEVPLWMFDRMMCSSARREHHPQVVITALADLQALLAEVTGAGRVDPRIASTDSVLSADLMSRDPNQGEVDAPSSYKPGFPRWMTNLMTCFADSAIRINAIPSALRANPMSPGG